MNNLFKSLALVVLAGSLQAKQSNVVIPAAQNEETAVFVDTTNLEGVVQTEITKKEKLVGVEPKATINEKVKAEVKTFLAWAKKNPVKLAVILGVSTVTVHDLIKYLKHNADQAWVVEFYTWIKAKIN